jgi:hypothetical protein
MGRETPRGTVGRVPQNVYGQDLPLPTTETFQVASTDFPTLVRKVVTIAVTGRRAAGALP